MTSQNQYQDDLMHRMMTAEEKPLSKTTKRDGSAEEDSQVAAGKSSDHNCQMLLTRRQDHHDHGASEPIQEIENTTSHEHGHREILSDLQGESQIASGKSSDRNTQILLTRRQDHHDHGASEPVPEIETTNFEHGHREIRSDLQGESPVVAGKSSGRDIQLLLTQRQAHDHHGASELIQGVDIANTEHHHREIAPAVQADSGMLAMLNLLVEICMFDSKANQSCRHRRRC